MPITWAPEPTNPLKAAVCLRALGLLPSDRLYGCFSLGLTPTRADEGLRIWCQILPIPERRLIKSSSITKELARASRSRDEIVTDH
jgi:hypothetical protein